MPITRSIATAAAAATFAAVALLATPAEAQILVGPGATHKEGEEPFPLHGQISLSQSLGSGTFASTWNPTTTTSLALAPWAKLSSTWVLSVNQTYAFEWTQSDANTAGYAMEMSDLSVRGTYLGLRWADLGLSSLLNASYALPLSAASRQVGSLGALGVGGRLNWAPAGTGLFMFGGMNVIANPMLAALGQRVSSVPAKAYADRTLGTVSPATCIVRSPQELQNFACLDGQLPSALSTRTSLGLSYTPPILDGNLFLGASMSYAVAFSPYVPSNEGTSNTGYPNDELSSVNAVNGIVGRQSTTGDLSVAYMPTSWVILTVGASSQQPLLTSEGKLMRFPFWDFASPYNNFSSLYVDSTFMF